MRLKFRGGESEQMCAGEWSTGGGYAVGMGEQVGFENRFPLYIQRELQHQTCLHLFRISFWKVHQPHENNSIRLEKKGSEACLVLAFPKRVLMFFKT